jgi:hypothetical protein
MFYSLISLSLSLFLRMLNPHNMLNLLYNVIILHTKLLKQIDT